MSDSTPICRCRVLYLGSAVPRQSKDGLQGIQEPLRSLYPSEGAIGAKGIDSWLSVWSNGILLENVDENLKEITRFFPIESLHYCAAVRQVLIPERGNTNPEPKFLPLDSPFARMPRAQHPPIFAAILRRTTGIKVLECHVFICKREAAANALVRCCFHAYADNSYARQLETGSIGDGGGSSVYGTLKSNSGSKFNLDSPNVGVVLANGTSHQHHQHHHHHHHHHQNHHQLPLTSSSVSHAGWRSRAGSITTLNSVGRQSNNGLQINGDSTSSAAEGYTSVKNFYGSSADLPNAIDDGETSLYNVDVNHKVWNGSQDQLDNIALESHYDMYSGQLSTLGRPARLRQITQPVNVPPPPLRDDSSNSSKKKKDKKLSKSSSSQSLSGTLIRPKPIHPAALHRPGLHFAGHPGPAMYGGGPMPGPIPMMRSYHTISHRGFPATGPIHPPPHIITPPPPMHPHVHPQIITGPPPPPPHVGIPMQHTLVVPQQYATLQPSNSTKKKKRDKKHAGIPVGMPIVPPIYAYHQNQPVQLPPQNIKAAQSMMGEPRPLALSNRKLAASMGNGLDDSGHSGADSPGGTGIYRRKGHLNERAFSYSIRQEHRSRSHGSLASLQFNPPDMKKEREIAQMVAGLDINDASDDHHYHHHPSGIHHQRISNASGGGGGGGVALDGVPLSHKHPAVINGNGAVYGNGPIPSSVIYGNSSSNFTPQRR